MADITCLANSQGGDLVHCTREVEAVTVEILGLTDLDIDDESLRLERMIRDGIEPRIHRSHIRAVEGLDYGPVIIIRFPNT